MRALVTTSVRLICDYRKSSGSENARRLSRWWKHLIFSTSPMCWVFRNQITRDSPMCWCGTAMIQPVPAFCAHRVLVSLSLPQAACLDPVVHAHFNLQRELRSDPTD